MAARLHHPLARHPASHLRVGCGSLLTCRKRASTKLLLMSDKFLSVSFSVVPTCLGAAAAEVKERAAGCSGLKHAGGERGPYFLISMRRSLMLNLLLLLGNQLAEQSLPGTPGAVFSDLEDAGEKP